MLSRLSFDNRFWVRNERIRYQEVMSAYLYLWQLLILNVDLLYGRWQIFCRQNGTQPPKGQLIQWPIRLHTRMTSFIKSREIHKYSGSTIPKRVGKCDLLCPWSSENLLIDPFPVICQLKELLRISFFSLWTSQLQTSIITGAWLTALQRGTCLKTWCFQLRLE